jgi:hypothetical protein
MNSISSVIDNKHNTIPTGPIGEQSSKPTGPTGKERLTKQEVLGCDIALSDYSDLMSKEFYAWYCKAFYKLGRERFARIASEARADGQNPKRLFSFKIKQELKNV